MAETKQASRKRKAVADADDDLGPYPTHAHPTPAEVRAVHDGLQALHPEICAQKKAKREADEGGCGSRKLVLDALVGTILSQNTTDVNSHRAFLSLKTAFPTWEAVRAAPNADVEAAIKSGGLAEIKTERIKAILETLQAERGELSLEYLRAASDATVKAELTRFKGVGAKTVSCVLLFCLGRDDFPVDTHVWKIALALNWVPKKADRDGTYTHLNARVPNELKYALHVLLVEHGKQYKNDVGVLRKMAKEHETLGAEAEAVAMAAAAQQQQQLVEAELMVKSEVKSEEVTVKTETEAKAGRRVRVKREA